MKKLFLILVLAVLLVPVVATAQHPKEYYEASVASNDFVIDVALIGKGMWGNVRSPSGMTFRSDIDCTVIFVDDYVYGIRNSEDEAITTTIHIWAGERKYIETTASTMQIEGALGGELSITVEYR